MLLLMLLNSLLAHGQKLFTTDTTDRRYKVLHRGSLDRLIPGRSILATCLCSNNLIHGDPNLLSFTLNHLLVLFSSEIQNKKSQEKSSNTKEECHKGFLCFFVLNFGSSKSIEANVYLLGFQLVQLVHLLRHFSDSILVLLLQTQNSRLLLD